ncbi:MAG: hypothetical protein HFI33_04840 [Lachnospiraceae bacterium]|nr:hypothetical protein [Lachnospiraceae bacterium]
MRRRKIRKIGYGFLSLLLMCSLGMPSFATEHIDDQIDEQEDRIEQTEKELTEAEQKQKRLEDAKRDMENYLSGLNKQYNNISAQIQDLEEQIGDKEAEIQQTQKELEEAQAVADKQYEDMKSRIQYMYENPQAGFFELLLVEGSFAQALTRATNTAGLVQYDSQKMEEYIATRDAIEEKEWKLEGEKEALDQLHAQVVEKQKEVEALANSTRQNISKQLGAIASAQAEVDGKEDTLANQKAVLDDLIREKKRIEAEIEAAKLKEINASLGEVTGEQVSGQENTQYGGYAASEEEVTALAVLIHCEAANQGAAGQLAVGAVVMNRIRDPRFGQNDIMSVIRASGQFSPVTSGRFDLVLNEALDTVSGSCYDAARRAIAGESNVGNRVFFRTHNNNPALSGLIIGAHIFSYTWNYSTP